LISVEESVRLAESPPPVIAVICNCPFLLKFIPNVSQSGVDPSIASYQIVVNGTAVNVREGIAVNVAAGGRVIVNGVIEIPLEDACPSSRYSPFKFPKKILRVSVHNASSPGNKTFG
jgi:hypothetical protein